LDVHIVFDLSGASAGPTTLSFNVFHLTGTPILRIDSLIHSALRAQHIEHSTTTANIVHTAFALAETRNTHIHSVFCIYPPFKTLVTFHKRQPIVIRLLLGQWKALSQSQECLPWRQPMEWKPYWE